MTNDLKEIRDLVEIVVKEIRTMEVQQSIMGDQVRVVKDQQSVMNDKLDNHTASLVGNEETLKGYGDMYKVNKEKSEDLGERVTVMEDHLGLTPAK